MKVITYATHSFGTFDEIVNNKHGVDVKVLGWGTKWKGFQDKVQGVYDYCKTLPDDEIVVFIDGFDSEIIKPLDGLEETFKSLNCGVFISRDILNTSNTMHNAVVKIFGTCQDGIVANSGLYMGTVFHLKIFLNAALNEDSSDDQTNFNSLCTQFEWIKLDVDNKIFYNRKPGSDPKWTPPGVYFKSSPATPSFQRYLRAITEYYSFFIKEISIFILVVVLILFLYSSNK